MRKPPLAQDHPPQNLQAPLEALQPTSKALQVLLEGPSTPHHHNPSSPLQAPPSRVEGSVSPLLDPSPLRGLPTPCFSANASALLTPLGSHRYSSGTTPLDTGTALYAYYTGTPLVLHWHHRSSTRLYLSGTALVLCWCNTATALSLFWYYAVLPSKGPPYPLQGPPSLLEGPLPPSKALQLPSMALRPYLDVIVVVVGVRMGGPLS